MLLFDRVRPLSTPIRCFLVGVLMLSLTPMAPAPATADTAPLLARERSMATPTPLGPAPVPAITGTARVGSTLTAVPGTWGPAPVALAYQWKANGTAVVGATATTYKPAAAQAGKTLTVTVTGTKTGYSTKAKTSAATAAVAVTAAGPGNDVSWPQCGKPLPKGQTFAIVGVNNGLANNTNPCLATQLSWAATSKGGTGQPLVALYVNTANPGTAGSWWPTSNTYGGKAVANPYGRCTKGSVAAACSYMYGYAKAYDDATIRGINKPASYTWWLDVETENTWSTDKAANRANLEGMAAYFASIGAKTGLYSTGFQWSQIVGTVPPSSNLYALPSWLAGASSLASANLKCADAPLTGGGKVTLTQYISGGFDYNKSCI
jgi:hypothetical protein